ncbi:unnamed protein product, partial [Adineta steineri]
TKICELRRPPRPKKQKKVGAIEVKEEKRCAGQHFLHIISTDDAIRLYDIMVEKNNDIKLINDEHIKPELNREQLEIMTGTKPHDVPRGSRSKEEDLPVLSTGRGSMQASHLCDSMHCIAKEHIVVESTEVNQSRRDCRGITLSIKPATTTSPPHIDIATPCRHEEPLAKCLELNEPIDFIKNIIKDALQDQCSFVVYDMQTEQLVGVCLNEIKFVDDQHIINEKNYFILHFLNQMHKNINLFQQFQTNSLLHIFIIDILKNYRDYGLGLQLISASIEHAKKIHVKGIYAEATNIYSLNCFKQQGFQSYDQINYTNYDQIRLANLIDSHESRCQLVARNV